eukprot:TRINITY_DN8637_c0_g2_i1.p1 TRINITY_DN8637_c0_g2~~TRINITY_DN8637_c0_g2_i1.p1  ORF type:complete len:769 (-),score=306.59 TRINITY_DN8637_c0_g2_i1:211-2517(-)
MARFVVVAFAVLASCASSVGGNVVRTGIPDLEDTLRAAQSGEHVPELVGHLSFLQVAEDDDLQELKKQLTAMKTKVEAEQDEEKESKRMLLEESKKANESKRALDRLQEQNQRMEKESERKDLVLAEVQKRLGAGASPSLMAFASSVSRVEALATARKLGAAKKEVEELQEEKMEAQEKLKDQQVALTKLNKDIQEHTRSVDHMKARNEELGVMVSDMGKAESRKVKEVNAESDHIRSYFTSLDKELKKAREKKADLDAQLAQFEVQRKNEEERFNTEVAEVKDVAKQVEDANRDFKNAKMEIRVIESQIQEQQQNVSEKQAALDRANREYDQEKHAAAAGEAEFVKLTHEVDSKQKEVADKQQQLAEIQSKAKAAKLLLDKEQQKTAEAQQRFQKDMSDLEAKAQKDAAQAEVDFQSAKKSLEAAAQAAEKNFAAQLQNYQKQQEGEIEKAKLDAEESRRKETIRRREAAQEQLLNISQQLDDAKSESVQQGRLEKSLRHQLSNAKAEEANKLGSYRLTMVDLEKRLELDRQRSNSKVQKAKNDLATLQDEVLSDEQAVKSKKEEFAKMQQEASEMEMKATEARTETATEVKHIKAKIRAAVAMEKKGREMLQHTAHLEAEKLRKQIMSEKGMEEEQVGALKDQLKVLEQNEEKKAKVRKTAKAEEASHKEQKGKNVKLKAGAKHEEKIVKANQKEQKDKGDKLKAKTKHEEKVMKEHKGKNDVLKAGAKQKENIGKEKGKSDKLKAGAKSQARNGKASKKSFLAKE